MEKGSNVAQPLVQAGLLGEAIDRGPMLVLVADEEMRYVAANQLACDVLGYTRDELLGLRTTDVARYDSAWNRKDSAAVSRLLAPDYQYFTSRGGISKRSESLTFLSSKDYVLDARSARRCR